jgi:hypothetical protein
VINHSTSERYEQLFPHPDTGQDNRIVAGKEYTVPALDAVFRVAGPPGYEVIYWMVTPVRLAESAAVPQYRPLPTPPRPKPPASKLMPRCDDVILRARGECVDASAGPKVMSPAENLPEPLAGATKGVARDLLFLREEDKSVISSPAPITGPVVYEFHLAHR